MAHENLTEYITQSLQQGINKEVITQALLAQGWDKKDIDKVFSSLSGEKGDMPQPSLQPVGAPSSRSGLIVGVSIVTVIVIVAVFAALFFFMQNREAEEEDVALSETSTPEPTPTEVVTQLLPVAAEEDAEEETGDGRGDGPLPYIDTEIGFSFTPPIHWEAVDTELMAEGLAAIFREPLPESTPPFVANINVVLDPAGGLPLAEYADSQKEQLSESLTDYEIVSERTVTVSGQEGYLLEGSFIETTSLSHIPDEDTSIPLQNLQLFLIRDDTAYIITATALAGSWDSYKELLEEALLTFTFLDI